MDAIEVLTEDHRQVEEMFRLMAQADDDGEREQLFVELADALAIHAAMEEQLFYPACRARDTDDELRESLQEHLQVKRLLADLLGLEPADEEFMAKLRVLEEEVKHHVGEEEGELFPTVRGLIGDEWLDALAQEMVALRSELEEDEPREQIPAETRQAARLE